MMTRRIAIAVVLVAAMAAPALAKPKLRAGVPVDSLTPAGMQRLAVRVPVVDSQPVRLTYGTEKAEILVDVVVAATAADAREALEHWRHQLSREIDAVTGVGDVAYGSANLVAFAQDNIMIAVRRVSGTADIGTVAADALAAAEAAPKGSPVAETVTAAVPTLATGKAATLSLSRGVLAARVSADGPATVRKTRTGWRLFRKRAGDVRVRVVAVDELLRVSR